MHLARVIGNLVSTIKSDALLVKLLIIQPLAPTRATVAAARRRRLDRRRRLRCGLVPVAGSPSVLGESPDRLYVIGSSIRSTWTPSRESRL